MVDLPSLRRKYGPVFITTLKNGDVIPWKQLSIGDYLEYSALLSNYVYAKATIEDEIFSKCVLDEYVVDILPALKAGTVSTVVKDIIENSGPVNIQDLNQTLDIFRSVASQAIHQTVVLVAQAFPGYKLEDIYEMNYSDFMLRLAQAESKMLQLGILEEPINFQDPQMVSEAPEEEPMRPMDMYLKYLETKGEQKKTQASPVKKPPSENQTVIRGVDSKDLEMEMSGHEKEDNLLQSKEMLDDAALIYKDYLEQMSAGNKLEIQTPEERVAAAEQRAKNNEQILNKELVRRKKSEEVLEDHYAQILKRAAAKKR